MSKCIVYVSSTGFSGHENWIWKHRRAESCHSAGAGESILTSWRAERHISNGFRSPTTGEYCDNHNVDLCDRERWEAATPSCAAPAVKLSAGWRKLSANRGSLQRWHSLASTSKTCLIYSSHTYYRDLLVQQNCHDYALCKNVYWKSLWHDLCTLAG